MTSPSDVDMPALDESPAAPATPRTTLGHLVYAGRTGFDFPRLVADLNEALSGLSEAGHRLAWDHDDVALIDIGSSRIVLSMAEGGRGQPTVVTVAVGEGPEAGGDLRLAERRDALARLIAGRIAERFAPERTFWTESAEVATAEHLDDVVELLAQRLGPVVPQGRAAVALPPAIASKARAARARVMRSLDAHAVMPALFERADAAMAARSETGFPVANDAPDLPRASSAGLRAVRSALYAGPEDYRHGPSPAMRLAAHALDAALMMVLLPVGVGMMTYSLARGANLTTSGRMLAICGIGVGAANAVGGMEGLTALRATVGV